MSARTKNYFEVRFGKDKEYQRILKEERELLDLTLQLIEARKRKRLTQAQLARRARMPQSQIARIEGGGHNVTIATLYRVAGALNLRVKLA